MTSVRESIHYDIRISNWQYDNTSKLYLLGYHCSAPFFVDSATVKNGKAKFKSKKIVDKGVYRLVADLNGPSIADIMLQDSRPLKLNVFSVSSRLISNNQNGNYACKPGYYAFNYANVYDNIMNNPQAIVSVDTFRQIVESYTDAPGSFIEQFYFFDNVLAAYLSALQKNPQQTIPQSIFDYVISKLDLSNPLLWDSKSAIHSFIAKYLADNQIFDVEYLQATVENLLTKCEGYNQKHYLAAFLFNAFWATGDPSYEPLMLYLYDKYDLTCWLYDRARAAKRKMDVVQRLAPGAQIPELTAYDINGKQHSTNDIKTKYTVLWFWDPDCDHCQEETPILHDIYQKQADELGFEVFAVEVNDDYDRWKAFSEKHGLNDWVNMSTSMGETSVDYIEYFDIVTTPVILLIDNDNNHAIIARQVTLEELVRKMER